MKGEDDLLDEILAKGSLGGPVRDQILQRVLERSATAPARPRSPVRVLRWLAIPCLAAAGWLLFARPLNRGRFTSKDGAETRFGAVDAACSPSGPRVCHVGETLIFTVNAAVASGYLGAYAERVGDPTRQRIWYFPNQSGSAPRIEPGKGTIAIRSGVEIGPEHEAGIYRITAWTSDHAIERAEIGPSGPPAFTSRSSLELKVVR